MEVDPGLTDHHHAHAGQTYHFCSAYCLGKFAAKPDQYLGGGVKQETLVRTDIEYTCPMHPDIIQIGPGLCPICAMALEPLDPTAAVGPNIELIDMSRRFGICGVLTIPVLLLAMGELTRPSCHRTCRSGFSSGSVRPLCYGAVGRSSNAAGSP